MKDCSLQQQWCPEATPNNGARFNQNTMQQEDYIKREIEKIGLIMSAIGSKIFGGKMNHAVTTEKQISDAKSMMLNNIDFDLDKFLSLNSIDATEFISRLNGFNIENIESLAKLLFQIGLNFDTDQSKTYLEKALLLYEICEITDRAYSMERQYDILRIKQAILPNEN